MVLDTSLGTNPQFVSVDLARLLLPGTFEHALHQLRDYEVDLAHGDTRFRNDTTGAPAYPRIRVSAGHAAQGGALRLLAGHRAPSRDRACLPKRM